MNLNQPISRVLLSSVLAVGLASSLASAQDRRPSAPARLAAAAGQGGSVTLTWIDRSSNESGFRITRQPAFPDGERTVPADQTSFTDQPGTGRFVYRVAAFNDAGRSAWTGAATIRSGVATPTTTTSTSSGAPTGGSGGPDGTVTPNPPGSISYGIPNAPSALTTTPGLNQILLSWNDNSNNEIFFEIQKQTQVGQNWQDNPGLQVWIDNTTITDTVTPGTYRYRVRAAQFAGYSAYTSWVTGTVVDPAAPPAAPSNLAVTDAGSGRAQASWTDNATNETSYKLERNPAFPAGVITLNANTTSYIDPCGNGSFSYRVRTANAAGTSAPTAWVSVNVTSGATGGTSGACCTSTGSCSMLTQAACVSAGGIYRGDGITCAAANCTPTQPSAGWTNLSAPAGAQVFYVAANGSDSNAGTQAAPFRSLGRGYSALRANQPDQMLLRCGDTWTNEQLDLTKGSGSGTTYMVIGSYGTGPRPKIRSDATPFNGSNRNVRGLAIVDLDVQPASGTAGVGSNGFWFSDGWADILIEGNYVSGYPVNFGSHAVANGRIDRLKIRRNVIVDSNGNVGEAHSQNVFLGEQFGLVIEENIVDRAGRTGNQTIFRHNFYIHDNNAGTDGIFRGNITARACATGAQQRPGGTNENNLSLQNPVGLTWGGNGAFRYNVAIDGRDINNVDTRAIAFHLGGTGPVENNFVGYQVTGTENVIAFNLDGYNGPAFRGNYVYDWKAPGGQGWAAAVQWDSGGGSVIVENNKLVMPNVGMLSRHESRTLSSQFTYRNNTYWSSTPSGGVGGYLQFSVSSGEGRDWSSWRSQAGESGSTFLGSAPANPGASINDYMTSVGMSGGISEFMSQARLQSRQNWRPQFTADAVNDFVRSRVGMGANP